MTRGSVTRPSTVTTASTSTTPEYFALRASSEYGGLGMEKQLGEPTPLTPARNAPPPVPPPSPGPRPPPLTLPMPPPLPGPMPPPLPGPFDMVTEAESGSPKFDRFGFATFSSGGPSNVGSMGSLGSGFLMTAVGGVNCVMEKRGARPLVAGSGERSPPPPPPPALLAPAGSFET